MNKNRFVEDRKMFLESDQIFLRKIDKNDITDSYHSWLNDPDVTKFMEISKFPISKLEMRDYICSALANNTIIFLAICLKQNGLHVGNVKLWNINWPNRTAMISVMIGSKKHQGQGIGKEVIRLVTSYAFKKLGLLKLNASIVASNTSSLRIFMSNGFEEEGRLRQQILVDGERLDQVWLGKQV